MAVANRVTGAIALVVGLTWALLARGLPLQQGNAPGPGLFPLALGLVFAAMGAGLLAQSRADRSAPPLWPDRAGARRVLLIFCALAAYIALVDLVGFPSSTTLFLIALFRAWGGYRWRVVIALAAALSAANYVIFEAWLGLSLPSGSLLDWG